MYVGATSLIALAYALLGVLIGPLFGRVRVLIDGAPTSSFDETGSLILVMGWIAGQDSRPTSPTSTPGSNAWIPTRAVGR